MTRAERLDILLGVQDELAGAITAFNRDGRADIAEVLSSCLSRVNVQIVAVAATPVERAGAAA